MLKNFKKHISPLVLAFIFALTGGIFAFAQNGEPLSVKDQAEVFEDAWKLVNEKYYDPKLNGVDWKSVREKYKPLVGNAKNDAEFYVILKQMMGEMKDAHTRFLTPREAYDFKNHQSTSVGINLDEVEGKTVVVKVAPDSEAGRANIKAGMILQTIDNQPIADKINLLKENLGESSSDRASKILLHRRLLDGEPETTVKIGLIDKDGKSFETILTRKVMSQQPKINSFRLPSGFAYISINRFFSPVSQMFKKELEAVKDAPGLIIDLRYNGGGEIAEVVRIAGLLVNQKTSMGKVIFRGKEPGDLNFGENGKQIYSGPIVVLVNDASASGSELLASGLQEAGRAEVVGERSCGCLLGIMNKRGMKGGGELHISEMGFLSAKGKIYEKAGITPDESVEQKIVDLQNGYDRDIAQAEKILAQMIKKETAIR
jgi:carboxyl-terminal processing protease